jgi:hypothetical protein
MMQGMMDYMMSPKEINDRHKTYSAEFERRITGGFSRDVADVFQKGFQRQFAGGGKSIQEIMMSPIKFTDRNTVATGMQGAVLQVLDEIEQGSLSREVKRALDITNKDVKNLSPEQRMELAYQFADFATERTQPMFAREHQSSLQRGSAFEQLMTMFGSFTNQALNLVRRTYNDVQTTGDPAAVKKLTWAVFIVGVVNPAGVIAINELRDMVYGKDDDKDKLWMKWAESIGSYFFFIRDLSHAMFSKMQRGTFFGHDVSIPVLRPFNILASAIAHAYNSITETRTAKRKKEAMRALDQSLNFILMTQGVPYYAPKQLTEAAIRAARE